MFGKDQSMKFKEVPVGDDFYYLGERFTKENSVQARSHNDNGVYNISQDARVMRIRN